jgi:hypothetical protein
MIAVEAYNTFDQDEWHKLIVNVGGNNFHLPYVWLVDNIPKNIRYLVLKNHKHIIGACIALYHERKFLKLFKSSCTLYLPTFPAISEVGEEDYKHILDGLLHFAAKAGFNFLKIGLRWGADLSHYPKLNKFIDERLIEFTIDLRDDINDIKSSFHKKHRKNIRKASEYNIEIITDNSLEGFMKLKELQKNSSARASTKGNVYDIQNERFYIQAHQHVYKRGLGNVMFVKKDERYVAGLAYLFFNNKAVTVRSVGECLKRHLIRIILSMDSTNSKRDSVL